MIPSFLPPSAYAQGPGDFRQLEIRSIEFTGNRTFGKGTLREVIISKESPGGFSQFLYRTFSEKLGSKPEYFEPVAFDEDIKRLTDFYRSSGFYDAVVTGSTRVDTTEGRTNLLFSVSEDQRSFVDSIAYRGLERLPDYVREKSRQEPVIQPGMPYERARATAEITRVLNVLADNGYPAARFDAEHSGAYKSSATKNFFLTLAFDLGRQYEFGTITIRVDPPREDITDNLTLRQLDFRPGETYSREKRISSERNVNRIGLFESARIEQGAISESTSTAAVPMNVFLRPRPRNELAPELTVSDENNAFNLGLGLGYTNRNFFGDARSFTARMRVRAQSLQDWNFAEAFGGTGIRKDTSVLGGVEFQMQILQPYLFERTLSGSWTSTVSGEKQKYYILTILRNRMGLSKQFATYTYGFVDWTLERVSPDFSLLASGRTALLDSVRREVQVRSPPQFNSIITVTLQRDKTNDIFSPTEGFFNSISLEESGVLPKLLPGIRSGLPFTQYYKVTLLGRWYHDLSNTRFNILALKLKTGYQDKYGESRTLPVEIPLNRRFYAGGSGSVRGWKARELGAMSDELVQFGGNFIVEGNVEMRVNHFRGFGRMVFLNLENVWGVYFLDFGNAWSDITDLKPKDIAVAAGFGFRYETPFGPFRIDYGFRVYDPKGITGGRTIFQRHLWGQTLGEGIFHFGIGHAF